MANAKKCDRCGEYYDYYVGVRYKGRVYNTGALFQTPECIYKGFDLCPGCLEKLFNFFGIEATNDDKDQED